MTGSTPRGASPTLGIGPSDLGERLPAIRCTDADTSQNQHQQWISVWLIHANTLRVSLGSVGVSGVHR